MKKAVSRTLIILAAVVFVLAAIIVTLSLIPVRKLSDALNNYDYVSIVPSGSETRYDIGAGDDADKDAQIKAGLKKTGFSVMHGILEGKFDVDYNYVTEKDEDDNDINVYVGKTDLDALSPSSDQYKVTFVFEKAQYIRVENDIISFDSAVIIVPSSSNKIVDVKMYLYESDKINIADGESSEAYTFTPIVVRANISYLYNAVDEICDSYNS